MLTLSEIAAKNIVIGEMPKGKRRPTTYDATVGCIIHKGAIWQENTYVLPPRGIVWVVSEELFQVPATATGLATLRTTWTHDGVLALNVGVVDPGWDGPLSAAIVNFGSNNFPITRGEQFLRLMFHEHQPVDVNWVTRSKSDYIQETLMHSRNFSHTFLNMDSLVKEVADEIFSAPRWALWIGLIAIVVSVLAIFAPVAFSVWTDFNQHRQRLVQVEKEVDTLETLRTDDDLADLKRRIEALEAR